MSKSQTNFQTPMKRLLGIGAIHVGSGFWLKQRASAVVLLILGVWLAISFSGGVFDSYQDLIAWIAKPWNRGALLFLLFSMTLHMAMGLQVVAEDYISARPKKLAALFIIYCASFLAMSIGLSALFSI